MKIAIDISPISDSINSGHKIRGVGKYIQSLQNNLPQFDKKNTYVFFENESQIPSDADIIHYPYFEPFQLVFPKKNLDKTVITVHDLTPIKFSRNFPVGVKGKIKWMIQRRNLKKVAGVITDSESSQKDIVKYVDITKNKIHVVYLTTSFAFHPIDKSKITHIKKKFSLPDKFILYVGDVTWNKNLNLLAESVKNANVPIVMVGKALTESKFDYSNAWNESRIEFLKKISKDDKFHLLGFISDEDLRELYNAAILLIMPSLYEGFGLPVLEAMQSGCPVITTTCGSLKEVGGDAVFYVDPYDQKSITAGILKVYSDVQLQHNLSKKGLKRAELFNKDVIMKSQIDTYEFIAKNRST